MPAQSQWQRALSWAIAYEGSTRSAAVLRIFAVILLWARHTKSHLVYMTLDDPWHLAFSLVFFFGGALVLVGWFTRAALWTTTLSMILWHVYGINVAQGVHGSTFYIIYLFTGLSFTECGKSLSVDRYLAVRRAAARGLPPPPERGAVWGLRIICWHITMMYLWGAYDKSDAAWLAGERMERYWIHYYGSSDAPQSAWLQPIASLSAIAVVLLEYALAFGLWFRQGRRYLVVPGILMHFGMYAFLPAYHISWLMWIAYLAFMPVDDFHRFIDTLLGHGSPGSSKETASALSTAPKSAPLRTVGSE